jgi:predicted SAM-dependent methyltransferase
MPTLAQSFSPPYKIDIGCGQFKKPGYIGIDRNALDGVDVVVDFEKDSLPFPDGSVSEVFSSHCLEHLTDPLRFFREIGRVTQDGAKVEIWTPYAFSNPAFIFGHIQYLNELHYTHMCLDFQDMYKEITNAYWRWHSVTYVVTSNVLADLAKAGVSIDFAIKYHKNVVHEFGVTLFVLKSNKPKVLFPQRRYCLDRLAPAYAIKSFRGYPLGRVTFALKALIARVYQVVIGK